MKIRLYLALWLLSVNIPHALGAEFIAWQLGSDAANVERARTLQGQERLVTDRGLTQLYAGVQVQLHDGYVVERVTTIYEYHDMVAVQQYGRESISVDVAEDLITVLEAAVISSTGQRYDFAPASVEINDTNSFDVFTDQVDVVLQLPGLDAGSVSVLVYERRIKSGLPYHLGEFVQNFSDRQHWELQMTWEGEKPEWALPETTFLSCTEGHESLHCEARDVPAAVLDASTYYLDELPELNASVAQSWEDVIALVGGMVESSMAQRGQLFGERALLFQQSDTPLQDIHDFVSRDIRYVSFSRGENSHQPHSIEDTLSRRYGDCKDKSALMMAMLREQGYQPYAVLVATDREKVENLQVPSHRYFDHMVVCIEDGEEERCFDATDSYTDASTLSYSLQGKVRLAIRPGAKPDTFPRNPHRWRFEVANDIVFSDDGGQEEKLERVFQGEYAAFLKGKLAGLDRKALREWLESEYSSTIGPPAAQEFEVQYLDELSPLFTVRSHSTYAPLVDPGEALDYEDSAFWLRSFAASVKSDNKYDGFYFPGARIQSKSSFDLNGLWESPEPGPTVSLQTEYGDFQRTYEESGDTLRVHTALTMSARWIAVSEVDQFNRFLDLVFQESRIRFWADKAQR